MTDLRAAQLQGFAGRLETACWQSYKAACETSKHVEATVAYSEETVGVINAARATVDYAHEAWQRAYDLRYVTIGMRDIAEVEQYSEVTSADNR